jgi:hypothetical protein
MYETGNFFAFYGIDQNKNFTLFDGIYHTKLSYFKPVLLYEKVQSEIGFLVHLCRGPST